MKTIAPLLAALLMAVQTAAAAPATRPQTGHFQITFTDRSPESAPERLARRAGWSLARLKKEGAQIEYDLPAESFEAYVPDPYDGSTPYGLLIWISPSPSAKPMGQYLELLDKHRLIYVGANKSGNDRLVLNRLGLAIDAASNMQARYAIDPDRVYVTGVSGGGRCASILGVIAPDIFRGGMYMIGSDFYRQLPADEPNQFYPLTYTPPAPKLLNLAKHRSRHVLLTGDNDGNRGQTRANYDLGFLKDGFEYVTYFQVPRMGHQPPPADWFEKGLEYLDQRPTEKSEKIILGPVTQPATVARAAPQDAPSDAPSDRLLRVAKLYLSNHRPEDARAKLSQIIKDYPQTPAAAEAGKLLRETQPGS
jgi:hypothetical protein